jgi:hypothetical protein
MSKQIEAIKQALDALQESHHLIEEHERPEYLAQYDRVISALTKALAEQPAPPPPPECQTEAEKTAFAFGWWKALESVRQQPAQQEPSAEQLRQIIKGLERCHVPGSKAEFLRVWICDWTAHKLGKASPPAPAQPLTDERRCPACGNSLKTVAHGITKGKP